MKAEELPPWSVVASRDEAWIREDEENVTTLFHREGWIDRLWSGAFSQMTNEEINEMLESGMAKVLRVGGGE